MPCEITSDLRLILENQPLEFSDVVELPPVRQLAVGFNGQRVMKIKRPAVLALTEIGNLVLVVSAIAIAPAPHDIEVFQGEALRIDLVMTGGATRVGAMLVELLADGHCSTGIGIDSGHARRRR